MDILKMLAELRAERQRIDHSIGAIERLAVGSRAKGRERKPKRMKTLRPESRAKPGRKASHDGNIAD